MREQFAEMYFISFHLVAIFIISISNVKRRFCALHSQGTKHSFLWLFFFRFFFVFCCDDPIVLRTYFACFSALNFSFLLIRRWAWHISIGKARHHSVFHFYMTWSKFFSSNEKPSAHAIIIYNYPFRCFMVMATICVVYFYKSCSNVLIWVLVGPSRLQLIATDTKKSWLRKKNHRH